MSGGPTASLAIMLTHFLLLTLFFFGRIVSFVAHLAHSPSLECIRVSHSILGEHMEEGIGISGIGCIRIWKVRVRERYGWGLVSGRFLDAIWKP